MKYLLVLLFTITLGACAAPQPVPDCHWDPELKLITGGKCDDSGTDRNVSREPDDTRTTDTSPTPSTPSTDPTPTGGKSGTTPPDNGSGTDPNPSGGDKPSDPNTGGNPDPDDDPVTPPDTPSNPPNDDEDEEPKDKGPKGNASANNGKGGNYDKTGHSDNGKGQGRNKK